MSTRGSALAAGDGGRCTTGGGTPINEPSNRRLFDSRTEAATVNDDAPLDADTDGACEADDDAEADAEAEPDAEADADAASSSVDTVNVQAGTRTINGCVLRTGADALDEPTHRGAAMRLAGRGEAADEVAALWTAASASAAHDSRTPNGVDGRAVEDSSSVAGPGDIEAARDGVDAALFHEPADGLDELDDLDELPEAMPLGDGDRDAMRKGGGEPGTSGRRGDRGEPVVTGRWSEGEEGPKKVMEKQWSEAKGLAAHRSGMLCPGRRDAGRCASLTAMLTQHRSALPASGLHGRRVRAKARHLVKCRIHRLGFASPARPQLAAQL
jgi:hypothetical protein